MNRNTILLFYKYTNIEDPKALMEREKAVCSVLGLKGRILVAGEGINGTVEGTNENTEKYIAHILSDKRFKGMNIKTSSGTEDLSAFPKLVVKVKGEIVSTKLPKEINPNRETGKHLDPTELKKWYENNEDFVIVDMRNDYELDSGYFEKTVNNEVGFNLNASRDLPEALQKSNLRIHKDKKIVTVCTGGVRCEKMSAYLVNQGFNNVYQLHNGMHAYMEKYPGQNFKGTLFTFDNRMVMDFGGDEREVVGKCVACDNASENYTNCSNNSKLDKNDNSKKLCNKKVIICKECINNLKNNKEDILCKDCKVL